MNDLFLNINSIIEKFCLDVVTFRPTLGAYLKEDFLFPGEGVLYFWDSRAIKDLAERIHIKWILNMVFMEEDCKVMLESMSEQQKVENSFNQHKFRVS